LPEAARAYAVAAKRSAALYAYDEARTFASRALALAASDDLRCEMYLLHESASDKLADRDAQDRDLTALAEIAPRTIYEIDYVLARVRVAMYRARYEEAEEMLARAKVAVPPADARRRGEIRVFEAELLYHRGAFVAAKAMMEATIASFEQSGQDLGTLHALDTFLNMAMSSLDLPLVMAYGRRMLAHAERIGAIDRQACAHEKLGAALQRLGSIPEALEHLETARALYARVGDVPAARVAAYGMATVQIMQGRYDIARTLFASGLADIADLQNAAALAAARNNLAATELLMGDLEAAARIARQALEEFGDARGGHYVQLLLILAVSLHYLGRSDEAIAVARTAAGAARPYGDSDTLAESLLQCLLMSLCRGELGEARALRDELLNMSEKTRDASLFPECFPWILASVADCDSDVEGAKVLRQQALTLFAAHQERLPPEGRELYRRVVWIAPMAGAHTSDAWRTPSP
jgi:tetratricopeptide (TPR) repeat protein